MNDWNQILTELNVNFDLRLNSLEELDEFEKNSGIKLPEKYKEYCQNIGAFTFNETKLTVFNIDFDNLEDIIEEDIDIRETFTLYKEEFPEAQELLRNSFRFGMGYNLILLLFDLRTYSEIDRSYDIYILKDRNVDMPMIKLGRDFYLFIKDYCMGQKMTKEFADLLGINT
jgi:SMI1 / KNR4 family (SUKH-1)